VIPNAENLNELIGQEIRMDRRLTRPPTDYGAIEESYGVSLEVGDHVLLSRNDEGDGLWVPYAEGKAVIGYMNESQSWVASGPFSGCEFAVGKNKRDGRVFAAHIAKQSGSTGTEDYQTYRTENDLSEWYWNRIPLPNPDHYSCSYVFVICNSTDKIISMVRMDVDVRNMGGSDGTITHIHVFK
jgi:hypothetical protein